MCKILLELLVRFECSTDLKFEKRSDSDRRCPYALFSYFRIMFLSFSFFTIQKYSCAVAYTEFWLLQFPFYFSISTRPIVLLASMKKILRIKEALVSTVYPKATQITAVQMTSCSLILWPSEDKSPCPFVLKVNGCSKPIVAFHWVSMCLESILVPLLFLANQQYQRNMYSLKRLFSANPSICSPSNNTMQSREYFGRGISSTFLFHPTSVCLARRMRGGRRTRHREPSPGDWLCQCGETNYRSKRECFKCGAPAPPLPPGVRRPSLPGEDPNDWACACGQMNFRGSVVCHKCSQAKPTPPGKETLLWTCPHCKGINREHRKTCFKCGAISPNFSLHREKL